MKLARFAIAALAGSILLVPNLFAQDKSSILKVQVTIAEQEGEKKVANLPYTFFLRSGEEHSAIPTPWTKVRVGSRVPVYAGKDGWQYLDVGTNIDARAFNAPDGRFDISINLERSWVEGEADVVPAEKTAAASAEFNPGHSKQPIIRQFRTECNLTMKDGQTTQSTTAADPLSARVSTITVTVNVVK